jgi:hypothetical protein
VPARDRQRWRSPRRLRARDGCSSPTDGTEQTLCADGIDNDGDGLYDHPEDPECLAPHDNTEHSAPRNPGSR